VKPGTARLKEKVGKAPPGAGAGGAKKTLYKFQNLKGRAVKKELAAYINSPYPKNLRILVGSHIEDCLKDCMFLND